LQCSYELRVQRFEFSIFRALALFPEEIGVLPVKFESFQPSYKQPVSVNSPALIAFLIL
jgi:hypothetical protein